MGNDRGTPRSRLVPGSARGRSRCRSAITAVGSVHATVMARGLDPPKRDSCRRCMADWELAWKIATSRTLLPVRL